MYFGSHDLVKDKSSLRSKNGCALEIIKEKLCAKNGLFLKNGDRSLHALLVMIKRVTNNELDCDKEVIECHQWIRLVLMKFLVTMLDITHPEEYKLNYDYKEKGLQQDDVEWKKLISTNI